jgi:glycosyltransferase involved in cell wall biosynthesis
MKFSLIIPLHNESGNVERISSEVHDALSHNQYINDYEIICIDDSSTDDTLAKLKNIKHEKFKIFKLSKRGGQSAAIAAGIKKSAYEVIGIIDADLQTSPYDYEKLLKKMNEGFDCVIGCRKHRKDNLIKRISTKIARLIRQTVLGDNFYDIAAPLKVFRKECVDYNFFFDTFHRYIPVLIQMQGFSVSEVDIDHSPRIAGESKYGINNRLWSGIISMFVIKWMIKSYLYIDTD